MKIDRLDHVVLTVRDIDATIAFCTRVLGMQPTVFGNGRHALTFGRSKINLHQLGHEFEPKASHATAGSADLCFIVEDDIDHVIAHARDAGVAIEDVPVQRSGATGPIVSCYLRDPDGNLIELSNYVA